MSKDTNKVEKLVFSTEMFAADQRKVIAHAASVGAAVVVGKSGKSRVAIDIPVTDLPGLD